MMQSDQKFSSSSCILTTLVFLIYISSLASSLDTLKPGDVLNSTSSLVSAKNNFTIGFYTPDGSNNSYVAIWYTDISYYPIPIWIGNRDNPVLSDSRPVLKINSAGSLLISRQGTGEDPIELYSGHESSRNVSATLLDSGNFVLMSSNGSGSRVIILWQSFDYPTNTLLPGMKLGVNHKTGRNWMLCSWLSPSNPASGAFTMEWDGRRLIVRRRGVMYWTSGKMKDYYANWDHLKKFENIDLNRNPENLRYNFTSYSSENEEYFMYSLIIDPVSTPNSQNFKSGWRLDDQGDLYNNNGLAIAKVSLCYGYNKRGNDYFTGNGYNLGWKYYPGCELWEQPKCRNRQQSFVERSGYFSRNNGDMPLSVYEESSNLSLSDCREHCWNDCKCAGYIGRESGCTYFRGEKLTFEDGHYGSAPTLHVLYSPSSYKRRRRRRRLILITLAVVLSTGLLVLVAAFFLARRPKQRKEEEELHELLTLEGYSELYKHENEGAKGQDLTVFTYASITAATNNFSPDYKLGEGGFGPVYKGKTTEGQEIAVKLLSRKSGQGLLEFKTELKLISKLQHVNLVELVGFCIHGDHKMIVYDYMANKSLDFHLFDPSKKDQLDWGCRLKIIEGTAQGILYLHKYSRLKIVHRDLKSGNILLDKHMNPKISDFGLARIFKQNMNEANTNRRVGTYGYMAPEYAMQGIFSYKSDVYSFGVLILEIVSGRRNNSFHDIEGPLSLVEYTWDLWNKDSASELVDPTLRSSSITDQVRRCINIGLLCVEDRAVDRPDIEDVVLMLRNETSSLPHPKNPAFITRNGVVEELEKSKPEKLPSVNELTISEIRER